MSTIPVRVAEANAPAAGTLGVLPSGTLIKQIDADKIRQSVTQIAGQIAGILQDVKQVGDFKLKEVQVSVEISANGEVSIVGVVSGGAGVRGAMTLTFSV